MLYDHLQFIKVSLNYLSRLRFLPLAWDKSGKCVKIQNGKVIGVRIIEMYQISYFVIFSVVLYHQSQSMCMFQLFQNMIFWLSAIINGSFGIGIDLARKGGQFWCDSNNICKPRFRRWALLCRLKLGEEKAEVSLFFFILC